MSCTTSKGSQHDFLRGTLPGALMSLLAIVLFNTLKKYSEPSGNMQIRPKFRKSFIFIVEDGEGFVTIKFFLKSHSSIQTILKTQKYLLKFNQDFIQALSSMYY